MKIVHQIVFVALAANAGGLAWAQESTKPAAFIVQTGREGSPELN